LVAPVPSLFTFHIESDFLQDLAGISVGEVECTIPDTSLRERGALLVTHWGLSGPVILRLSAWGARILHDANYQFPLQVNWVPNLGRERVVTEFSNRRQNQPAKLVVNLPLAPLPGRLWEHLVTAAGIDRQTRWAVLSRNAQHRLIEILQRTELRVSGKSLNKDEFVTCGGIPLKEVNLKTMESRLCPGLYLAGEIVDIDGITGGFNFQAAWTTGWIAGQAIAMAAPE
jgi:predicted Rossmann fold flavoprotein